MVYTPNDKFAEKAKELGYRARSVFKIEEIQAKFKILNKGNIVLDLGAAPGSFVQYAGEIVGNSGKVIGIDLQEIEVFKETNIQVFKGDIFDDETYRKIIEETGIDQYDVITSDLAPKTTGIRFVDGGKSLELNLKVLEVCIKYLKKKGNALIKILPGFNEGDLISEAKKIFRQVKKTRPKAIRKTSGESYLVCIGHIKPIPEEVVEENDNSYSFSP